uniref:NADH-ubiquinone oxidoreductase chain 4 n=1 Tax=Unionicola parkeri TaxID=350891 RepID=E3W3M2_9ACAR|nr:NADH dehydrogenase subunit 4 [Unionicola parkeri]ADP01832.1 NADH dehydrogenase subunit 4 [Unionicola parkeri]
MGFFFILPFGLFFSSKNSLLEFVVLKFLLIVFFLLKGFDYLYCFFYYDSFSWSMLLLSFLICFFMLLGNMMFIFFDLSFNFVFLVFLMFFSLFSLFLSSNLFLFYVLFEFSVLPVFFIICGLGFSFERLESAIYMLVYTLFFSLPFAVFLFILFFSVKDLSFFLYSFTYFSSWDYFFVFFSVLMFFVKIPSFFLHLWLPKAHVEAPVSGSMILAGVLLKLGAFGLFLYLPIVFFQMQLFVEFFFVWGLLGTLLSSLACFFQVDLKKMIAYMSIMHMGIVISALFSFCDFSFQGVLMMLLGHGFVSSSLFLCLNFCYERSFSRGIFVNKGIMLLSSSLYFWFSLIISFNISVPPSMNFISELFLIFSLVSFLDFNIYLLMFTIFFNSVVSFYFFVSMFHGFSSYKFFFSNLSIKEMYLIFGHVIPLLSFLFFI